MADAKRGCRKCVDLVLTVLPLSWFARMTMRLHAEQGLPVSGAKQGTRRSKPLIYSDTCTVLQLARPIAIATQGFVHWLLCLFHASDLRKLTFESFETAQLENLLRSRGKTCVTCTCIAAQMVVPRWLLVHFHPQGTVLRSGEFRNWWKVVAMSQLSHPVNSLNIMQSIYSSRCDSNTC